MIQIQLQETIGFLNNFVRQNTFISVMILAVLGNIFTDLLKKFMFYILTSTRFIAIETGKGISNLKTRNLEKLLKTYKEDIIKVEKVKNNNQVVYNELIRDLYYCVGLFIILLIFYLIIIKSNNDILFYSFLGASSRTLFSIFAIIYYNSSLFENAKKFDKYKLRKEKKINLIENILTKQ